MTTSLYAALLALWLVRLSLKVIGCRKKAQVALGDGKNPELAAAIRAQGNAAEYIPIFLILLAMLEMNGGHAILLHLAGILMIAGRVVHAKALYTENLDLRKIGMVCTLNVIIALAFLNIGYFIYQAAF